MRSEFSVIYPSVWTTGLLCLLVTAPLGAQTSDVTVSGLADVKQTLLYRDADIDLSFGQTVSGFSVESNRPGWTWSAHLSRVTPKGEFSYRKIGSDRLSIGAEPGYWFTKAELQTSDDRARVSSFRRVRKDAPDDFGGSINLQPVSRISIGASLTHRNWQSTPAEFQVLGEGGQVRLTSPSNTAKLSLQTLLPYGIKLAASTSNMSLTPNENSQVKEKNNFIVTAEGEVNQSKATLVKNIDSNTNLSLGYSSLIASTSVQSFLDGRKFGHFGIVEGEAAIWDASLKRGRQFYGIQFGTFEGEIAGTIQAWPFVSNLLRFLGERRHFRANLKADFKRAWFERATDEKGKLDFGFRIEYFQIYPQAEWVSWRPLLFGFGVDDLKRDQLDISEAHLMRLQVSPTFRIKQVMVQMVAAQWIPLSVDKMSASKNVIDSGDIGTDDPDKQISASNSGGYQHSGFTLGISLRLDLGSGKE